MNPLNKANDTPENPTDDMVPNGTPENVDPLPMRSPATEAEERDDLSPGGDSEAVEKKSTEPGGNQMTEGTPSNSSARMQYSSEDGKSYSGSMVHGKVVHQSANSRINSYYGQ